ncbi:Putative protein [Zobellia galactanivorans]|uniref:Uncharacterized protein n=1 Tax=Zobellia galactanivorans (strain DSM 12802 / CCUG 47099 / CIP 106680 / NCIMB 13871 / Dsij) TaxID=63186 RepID=G0LBB6_ZOBGA|nr:Putative protein [Zobellia galactanivorans]
MSHFVDRLNVSFEKKHLGRDYGRGAMAFFAETKMTHGFFDALVLPPFNIFAQI